MMLSSHTIGMMAAVPLGRGGRGPSRVPASAQGGSVTVCRDPFDMMARAFGRGAARRTILETAGVATLGALGLAALPARTRHSQSNTIGSKAGTTRTDGNGASC